MPWQLSSGESRETWGKFGETWGNSGAEWPISRDAGSDAMRAAMHAKHGNGDAIRCKTPSDARSLAEILCDAFPRCENTSDAIPRCRPLSSGELSGNSAGARKALSLLERERP